MNPKVSTVLALHLGLATAFSLPVETQKVFLDGPGLSASCGLRGGGLATTFMTSIGYKFNIEIKTFDSLGVRVSETLNFNYVANEYAETILQTKDGGLAIMGVQSAPSGSKPLLLLTDAYGDLRYRNTYGKASYGMAPESFTSIAETADSGFIAAGLGSLDSDAKNPMLHKLGRNGSLVWSREFKGFEGSVISAIQVVADGGYVLAGTIMKTGESHRATFLLKMDSLGNALWQREYAHEKPCDVASLEATPAGGWLLAGKCHTPDFVTSTATDLETDADGYFLRTHSYPGSYGSTALYASKAADGGYIATGYNWHPTKGIIPMIVKMNAQGSIIAEFAFSQVSSLGNIPFAPIIRCPGKFMVCVRDCHMYEDPEYTTP